MPRYYCDYCDTYLTHDSGDVGMRLSSWPLLNRFKVMTFSLRLEWESFYLKFLSAEILSIVIDNAKEMISPSLPSVRKQHNAGYKHKANVRTYYQQFEEQQTQSLIDQRIKEHLGQTAAFQQVGGPYAAWQRGRPPILATPPILPIPVPIPPGAPRIPSLRPPVFPTPLPIPPGSAMPAPLPVPGGPPTAPLQTNGLPLPPALNAPPTYPGGSATMGSTMTSAAGGQPAYQPIPSSGGFAAPSMPPASSFLNSSGGNTAPAHSNADSFPYPQASSSGR